MKLQVPGRSEEARLPRATTIPTRPRARGVARSERRDKDSGAGPGERRGKDSWAGPGRGGTWTPGRGRGGPGRGGARTPGRGRGGAGHVLPGGAVIQMTVGVLHSASPRGIQKLGSFVWTPESLTARGVPKCLLGRRRPETGLN